MGRKLVKRFALASTVAAILVAATLLFPAPAFAEQANWTRLYGKTALDTMERVTGAGWKSTTGGSVVVATSDGYWDALTASGLAGLHSAPMLLTEGTELSDQTAEELMILEPSQIYVAGGSSAVSDYVLMQIADLTDVTPTRIYGEKATDTARSIYTDSNGWTPGTCIIATVNGFWDALSIAPYSYAKHVPIFLCDQNGLDDETLATIRDAGMTSAIIVGGEAAVPAEVKTQLADVGVTNTRRLWGGNCYETSQAIANWEHVEQGMSCEGMAIATATGYWDALTGAAFCGRENSILVLADPDYLTTVNGFIKDAYAAKTFSTGYVFGGEAAVPDQVKMRAEEVTRKEDPHDPLTITNTVDDSYDLTTTAYGRVFTNSISISTNNAIANVSLSDERILTRDPNSSNFFLTYWATEPGTCTITITDIYGQTVSKTISITQHTFDRNINDLTFDSSRLDPTMMVPQIEGIYYDSSNITVGCPATFDTDNPYGYETYYCRSTKFDSACRVERGDNNENGLGYTTMTAFYTGSSTSWYLRVRSYRIEGTTKVYGPWTTVQTVSIPDYSTARSTPANYSYQLYFLDSCRADLYTGIDRTVFLKTDNPSPSDIDLVCDGKSVLGVTITSGNRLYDDVNYLLKSDAQQAWQKVDGGYIGTVRIGSAEQKAIELREYDVSGYTTVASYNWTVQDYDTARVAWMNGVIAACTTSNMTPPEKMTAICNYLTNTLGFKYLTNSDGARVTLAAIPNGPYFVTRRWDSLISPTALCDFANLVGGFSNVHNCYYDYPVGSSGWYANHWYAELTYNGVTARYEACPTMSTGDVGTVNKIDFTNTSGMYPA